MRVVERRAGRVAEGPWPHLGGDVGHEAQDRRARAEGLLDRGDRRGAEDRDDRQAALGDRSRACPRRPARARPASSPARSRRRSRPARGWSRRPAPPTSSASARARSASTSLNSELVRARPRASAQPRASAPAMLPAPISPTITAGAAGASDAQLWLKKPFSSRRARSSAETSTLRGVSRNTLSAIRCMPPSSA